MSEQTPKSLKEMKLARLAALNAEHHGLGNAKRCLIGWIDVSTGLNTKFDDKIHAWNMIERFEAVISEFETLEAELAELETAERDHEIQTKLIDLEIAKAQAEAAKASGASLDDLIRGVGNNGSAKD